MNQKAQSKYLSRLGSATGSSRSAPPDYERHREESGPHPFGVPNEAERHHISPRRGSSKNGSMRRSTSLSPESSWSSSRSSSHHSISSRVSNASSTASRLSANSFALSTNSTGSTLAFPRYSGSGSPMLVLSAEDRRKNPPPVQQTRPARHVSHQVFHKKSIGIFFYVMI